MGTAWHQNFNPHRFLARIDVEKLITRNQAYPENETASILSSCILVLPEFPGGISLAGLSEG
jgi:hypothetical protein